MSSMLPTPQTSVGFSDFEFRAQRQQAGRMCPTDLHSSAAPTLAAFCSFLEAGSAALQQRHGIHELLDIARLPTRAQFYASIYIHFSSSASVHSHSFFASSALSLDLVVIVDSFPTGS
jgi:hypothetical protein